MQIWALLIFVGVCYSIGRLSSVFGQRLSLCYGNREDQEFAYRKQQAWAIFHKHKKIILNQNVSLKKRLKFFDACITPVVLFSLAVLPMLKSKIDALDVLQRKMLRRIVGWRRMPEESWRDTMVRMQTRMENATNLYAWEIWSKKYAKNLWNYGCHLAKSDERKWSKVITLESRCIKRDVAGLFHPYRGAGRPKLRWDDYFTNFFHQLVPTALDTHWIHLLQSRASDKTIREKFIAFVQNGARQL